MGVFQGLVDGMVSYYKHKEANKKPGDWDYNHLKEYDMLHASDYLHFLVDNAKKDEQLDAVHEYMNKFRNDRLDIYDIPSYMKISKKVIDKKGVW